jgi:hypothetical protein
MRFRVHRPRLLRLIGILTGGNPAGSKTGLLRLHAEDSLLRISHDGDEAHCEADISTPGVCFLRPTKLRQLLATYSRDKHHHQRIEIEVTPHSIRFGQTELPREGWEISLFLKPATAPDQLIALPAPPEPAPPDTQLHLPFDIADPPFPAFPGRFRNP